MAEKERPVETFLVEYYCDGEGCNGKVQPDEINGSSIVLTVHPPRFKHKCTECGKEYQFTHKYPYTSYKY